MPNNLKSLFVAVSCIVLSTGSFSAKGAGLITLEPIVGYERVQKLVPTPHSKDRLVYGARATAGILLISAEAEYLRGMDTEVFISDDLTVKDTTDKAKLGARSTLKLSSLLSFIIRAGCQASRNKHEETHAGVTTTTLEPIKYNPYAGAGVRAGLGKNFALTAEIVTVFPDFPRMTHNEYQTTAGFTVSFP